MTYTHTPDAERGKGKHKKHGMTTRKISGRKAGKQFPTAALHVSLMTAFIVCSFKARSSFVK